MFAARIRQWLKTLRKRNVSVIFATQSLADIQNSSIASAIIESCAIRIFLPNPQATEPQIRTIYQGFGLNRRQIEIVATARPKRDYRSEEHTSELQSLMRISYAVFCLKKKNMFKNQTY